jgi:hypothetical protein
MDDYQLCNKSPKGVNFFINGIVHVFILLTIISAFFFIYVSQLATKKFHNELTDVMNNNIDPALKNADKNQIIKKILQGMNLSQQANYFKKDSETTTIQNKWLMQATIGIIIMLILTMIIVLFITSLFCRKIPFGTILRENIILFALIGAVEIVFFLYIAKNFIPTKPSLVMETVVNSLKTGFTSKQ